MTFADKAITRLLKTSEDTERRLARVESRMIKGFGAMDVDVTQQNPAQKNVAKYDHSKGLIKLSTLNVTLSELFSQGRPFVRIEYTIMYSGQEVGVLYIDDTDDTDED